MAIRVICMHLVTSGCYASVAVHKERVAYGKYYSKDNHGSKMWVDNSYFMYRPQAHDLLNQGKLPVIIQLHGGGFVGGSPFTESSETSDIQHAIDNGLAYISVGYRLTNQLYYYGDDKLEELIHVDADGRLTLDTTGKTLIDDYKVRRVHDEYITKCIYDGVQMIEHLIAHADEYGIDIHRITFAGESAGGAEMNYLIWVYHKWNMGRYTPRGMVYDRAQLNYPAEALLGQTWKIWSDDVGEGTLVSSIIEKSECRTIIGNDYCAYERRYGAPCMDSSCGGPYNLCNITWFLWVMDHFCGDSFGEVTLAEVRDALVWPSQDPEVGKGMEVLWYHSINMQKHQPKPFYLYVRNHDNETDFMGVVHNAIYARNWAKYAGLAGITYTVYYTDYHAMTEEDVGDQRFSGMWRGAQNVWNYRSSHDWASQPSSEGQERASDEEQILYHCFALGVPCSVTPSKAPANFGLDSKHVRRSLTTHVTVNAQTSIVSTAFVPKGKLKWTVDATRLR